MNYLITREYKIVRKNKGNVEYLDATYNSKNDTLTFETDKFSVYAITFRDISNNSNTKIYIYLAVGIILILGSILLIKKFKK